MFFEEGVPKLLDETHIATLAMIEQASKIGFYLLFTLEITVLSFACSQC